jgi:RimJ/RimL family protein N-acetyltransferase
MNAWGEGTVEVCTPRLRLRLPARADAAALSALMQPSISARLASWPAQFDVADAERRIADNLAAHAGGQCLPLLICRRDDGTPLGWVSAWRDPSAPNRAILTYWLGEACHGQGLMREAAPPALELAFTELGVAEIRAAVQTDNPHSRAVLRGLGMHLVAEGHIWCGARGRAEACEWWSVARPDGLAQAAISAPATIPDPAQAAPRCHEAAD